MPLPEILISPLPTVDLAHVLHALVHEVELALAVALARGELAHVNVPETGLELVAEALLAPGAEGAQEETAAQVRAQPVAFEEAPADLSFVVEAARALQRQVENPI